MDQIEIPEGHAVYFVSGGELTKVGKSKRLAKRMVELQACSPVPLCLEYVVQGSAVSTQKLERALHRVLAYRHHHHEWFEGIIKEDEAKALVSKARLTYRKGKDFSDVYERVDRLLDEVSFDFQALKKSR